MSKETLRALHELKLPGMAKSWEALLDTHQLDRLSLREGFELMLQSERDTRRENRITRLMHNANFRQKATLEELETDTARGISSSKINELSLGEYINNGMTILITGPTGTGKSYLAQALGERACRQEKKVAYFTVNMLIEHLKVVKLEGRLTNFFKKLRSMDLLIIDDFGLKKLKDDIQNDFEQIIDDRYGDKAIVIAGQLPVEDWYNVFQSELIADACMDRLINNKTIKFSLNGESLRKKY